MILPDVRKSAAIKRKEEIEAEKNLREAEKMEKYSKWAKGLAQIDSQKKKAEEDFKEMSKPLARYSNDEDLEMVMLLPLTAIS